MKSAGETQKMDRKLPKSRLPRSHYLKLRRGGPLTLGRKGARGYLRQQNRALLEEALMEVDEENNEDTFLIP